ncbi:MAG: RHS repeat-associated core domain-containing protein [Hyphomicrobiaceae bacterium]
MKSDGRANATRRGFTDHTMLDNLALVHMKGRVYGPAIGRLLSADPYIPFPLFTQSWNRYSYVTNNPLSWIDPSGYTERQNCGNHCSQDEGAAIDFDNRTRGFVIPDAFGQTTTCFATCTVVYWDPSATFARIDVSHWVETNIEAATGLLFGRGLSTDVWGVFRGGDEVLLGHYAGHLSFDRAVALGTYRFDYHGALDATSIGLDLSGVGSVISWVPDVINGVAYGIEGDLANSGLSFAAAAPFAGNIAYAARYGPRAARGGAAAVRLGQAGEAAVRGAYNIGPATRVLVNGVERIPVGLTGRVLSEVKNVGSLSKLHTAATRLRHVRSVNGPAVRSLRSA